MFVGFDAAEREYENMTPDYTSDYWEDYATPNEVYNWLMDDGPVTACIASYLMLEDEAGMDEDRAAELFEDVYHKVVFHSWFTDWMRLNADTLREGFNKWWAKYNSNDEE